LATIQLNSQTILEDRRHALTHCIEKLSRRDRELLKRRYRADETVEQIALWAGRTTSSIYKSLQRIRNSLLLCIEKFLLRVKAGQRIELLSGLVELEFYSGANIILHGPVRFTPSGPVSARLDKGRVTMFDMVSVRDDAGHVPLARRIGFRITQRWIKTIDSSGPLPLGQRVLKAFVIDELIFTTEAPVGVVFHAVFNTTVGTRRNLPLEHEFEVAKVAFCQDISTTTRMDQNPIFDAPAAGDRLTMVSPPTIERITGKQVNPRIVQVDG
jgi:hypothetical protein